MPIRIERAIAAIKIKEVDDLIEYLRTEDLLKKSQNSWNDKKGRFYRHKQFQKKKAYKKHYSKTEI